MSTRSEYKENPGSSKKSCISDSTRHSDDGDGKKRGEGNLLVLRQCASMLDSICV